MEDTVTLELDCNEIKKSYVPSDVYIDNIDIRSCNNKYIELGYLIIGKACKDAKGLSHTYILSRKAKNPTASQTLEIQLQQISEAKSITAINKIKYDLFREILIHATPEDNPIDDMDTLKAELTYIHDSTSLLEDKLLHLHLLLCKRGILISEYLQQSIISCEYTVTKAISIAVIEPLLLSYDLVRYLSPIHSDVRGLPTFKYKLDVDNTYIIYDADLEGLDISEIVNNPVMFSTIDKDDSTYTLRDHIRTLCILSKIDDGSIYDHMGLLYAGTYMMSSRSISYTNHLEIISPYILTPSVESDAKLSIEDVCSTLILQRRENDKDIYWLTMFFKWYSILNIITTVNSVVTTLLTVIKRKEKQKNDGEKVQVQ